MATHSIRSIARQPKLRIGAASSFVSPPSVARCSLVSSHSFARPSSILGSCKLPRFNPIRPVQQISTFTSACTIRQIQRLPGSQISRWASQQSLQKLSGRTSQSQLCNLSQRRFISEKPSPTQEKDNAGGLTPTKIAAPTILKDALTTPHENIYTLPNFLTASRLFAAPVIGYLILHSQPVAALALFAYAGITDLVDGYLARRYNSQTVVGTIIDPMADKTLMTITVVCLAVQNIIPPWLAVIILGRDVALAISAIYWRGITLPPPKTMTRYWDFSLPSAEVRPTEISKINTLLQLLLVGSAMVLPVLPTAVVEVWNLQGVFEGWQILVASTTVWSGLSYVFTNDAVKVLSKDEKK